MIAPAVRADQIRALYHQSSPVLLANLINTLIVAATLWTDGTRAFLVVWAALVTAMTLVRLALRRQYQRTNPGSDEASKWGRRFVMGSLVAGLLWGVAAATLFDVKGPLSQILMAFVIGGMGAGAAGTLSSHLPAFWAYLLPSAVPLLVRVVAIGDPLHFAMAAMLVVYVLGLSFVARNTNRAVTEAFELRFANEQLNRTLERRIAERTAAFERQSEALRSAQRLEAVGRLAGGVAHDFNNLLTVIQSNSSLLLEDPDLGQALRTPLEEVRAASDRGADLVRQLLAFGRRQRLAPANLDLNRVVRDMQPLLERLITKRIALELSLAPRSLFVVVDRSQIEQVLVNLVTNARDAMPNGGRIHVSTEASNGDIPDGDDDARDFLHARGAAILTVADNGAGMDPETRRRAFEPFFTTKELGRGTGLGLATVYGIAEQSGGRVEVSSSLGEGSVFTVLLPLGQAPVVANADDTTQPPLPRTATTSATILLAEDDDAVRASTRRLLLHMGHRVLTTSSGEQALALALAHAGPIDLLITDVVMGKLGGPALALQLVALRPEMDVLLISGYSWPSSLRSDSRAQRFEFLQKPFSAESLDARVTALLSRKATHGFVAPGKGGPKTGDVQPVGGSRSDPH
jgi:signal transduction histidine kinase/ActR/RegA family two-component response regulator